MPPGFIAFQRRHTDRALFVIARCNGGETEAALTVPWEGLDILTGCDVASGTYPATALLAAWPALVLLVQNRMA
jgi:hypothetical protein